MLPPHEVRGNEFPRSENEFRLRGISIDGVKPLKSGFVLRAGEFIRPKNVRRPRAYTWGLREHILGDHPIHTGCVQ